MNSNNNQTQDFDYIFFVTGILREKKISDFYVVDVSLIVLSMNWFWNFFMYFKIVQMSNILMFCGIKFLTLEREIKI